MKQVAGNDADMAQMYEDDARSLQDIHDMSKEAFDTMQVDPPSWLQSSISRLDTIVRDQIPQNLYNWIIGQR